MSGAKQTIDYKGFTFGSMLLTGIISFAEGQCELYDGFGAFG